jgi:hypothetical protein
MQKKIAKFITATLATSVIAVGAHTATAQQQQPGAAPQPQAAPIVVDDETVSNFVSAYTDVREIHAEYAGRLQEVEDAERATELQQEAQEKIQDAVTENDITIEEYQQIARQIGQDAELRTRIQEELDSQESDS